MNETGHKNQKSGQKKGQHLKEVDKLLFFFQSSYERNKSKQKKIINKIKFRHTQMFFIVFS